MRLFRAFIAVAAIGAGLLPALTVHAQAYPSKPVRVLVPNTPGSSADVIARYVAQHLGEHWGQPVTVENRAGAGGIVAADAVAKAAPDGLTLLLGADGPLTILPALQVTLPYNPQRDLVPVVSLGETDFVLVAHPKTGFHSLQDFISAARRAPGRYNYASAGNGSPQQFGMELLKQTAGIHVTHIPYRGGPLGMADVIGGQVDVMFIAVGPALGHIKAGRLVALASGGAQRHALLPAVPAVEETYKGFRAGTWFGLLAPAGTPAATVAAISAQAQQLLSTRTARAELAAQGITATGYPSARFQEAMTGEARKYAALVHNAGLQAD